MKYRERNEAEREAYKDELAGIADDKRIYYIDETGKNKGLEREYGYAPKGKLVEGETDGKKAETLNIVAAKCGNDMVEVHEYDCNMNARLFELWFMLLLKCVEPGSYLIMDNARFHRAAVLGEMAEAADCHVLFLPAYSPDLNPIEQEWANLKKFLRNHGRDYALTSDAVFHYFCSA